VLKAESEDIRNSRLLLCDLAGRTIRVGLELLGIQVVDKM
jgi:arginyl-tRNA synthetase